MTLRITEAEAASDFAAVLKKVRLGNEVVIEHDHHAVAVVKPSVVEGRLLSEVIADLEARNEQITMDESFARDIQDGIDAQRQPWNPPAWD